jgi:hypothetical protein
MIQTILKAFTVINALIGLSLVAAAVWPASDPTAEMQPILVIIYLLWALFFLILTWQLFYIKPIARKWTIGLYGFISIGIIWLFLSGIIYHDELFLYFSKQSSFIYILLLIFFITPVVFMLHKDVKDFFIQYDQNRIKAEEESSRASIKHRL